MDMTKLLIQPDATIKSAMKKIDVGAERIVFVVDKNERLLGSLSDGDIRRHILKKGNIEGSISGIYNKTPVYVQKDYDFEHVKNTIMGKSIKALPVVDNENRIINILLWDALFREQLHEEKAKIDLPVVVMAGGKGSRLDPFTRVLPKPLIPIGDKPIIEIIMDKYAEFGMTEFFISVNYKARMIKAYFEDYKGKNKITFINEQKPLGTGGALKYLQDKVNSTFFVSNCDIIVNDDYTKIYEFHKKGSYAFTLVASMQHHIIPYGVCEIENEGELRQIIEKPEYNFLVNTGMYLLEPHVLSLIPSDTMFHITDLIAKLKQNKARIGVFPISEKSWIDIGQWEEYRKTVKKVDL